MLTKPSGGFDLVYFLETEASQPKDSREITKGCGHSSTASVLALLIEMIGSITEKPVEQPATVSVVGNRHRI